MLEWRHMGETNRDFDALTRLVDRVLAVPRSVVQQRVAEYRKQSERNPRRRGPKKRILPASDAKFR